MATTFERLALLITADGAGAVRELDRIGKSAGKNLGGAEKDVDRFAGKMLKGGAAMTVAGVGILKALDGAAEKTQSLADSVDLATGTFGSIETTGLDEWSKHAASAL